MKDKIDETNNAQDKKDFPGYPLYPDSEDIYAKDKKVVKTDPDSYMEIDNSIGKVGKLNEKDFDEDESGDDLDVPGSEFDEDNEEPGNEDEENEYYSLGGDDHDDLEEDRGEDRGDYIP